ncbi:MAG: metal ABC transporter substrate-binding protein [Fimbriimonadales bacterium]
MKKLALSLLIATAAISHAKTLNVIATVEALGSIAKSVGGTHVNVTTLVVGARDPHRIEAKPSYISAASRADLWLAIGLELEIGYEEPIISGSGNGKLRPGSPGYFAAGNYVSILEKPSGAVTRAQGDIHPYGNPHVWLDPYNGRVIALKLAERLSQLDPASSSDFRKNADAFVGELDRAMFGDALVAKFGGEQLWKWDNSDQLIAKVRAEGMESKIGGWFAKMRPHWKTKIVTYHRSWVYFAFRFGLNVIGELEPKPGIDPTPSHVANTISKIKSEGAKLIIQEPFYSTKNATFVSQRTDVPFLVLPGNVGHDGNSKDYISLFDTLVNRISQALGN